MPGLVSLLDQTHHALVEEIWQELESDCQLMGIYVTPIPHFSWQIADDYDWDSLEIVLQEIAVATQPFMVQTSGIALFTAENPVAYNPIVRTKELSERHKMIWDRLAPISTNPSFLYAPSNWMPHITLAYSDVNAEKLHCLVEKLAFRPINWEIEIDNFTLIDDSDGNIGQIRQEYSFGKKESEISDRPKENAGK